MICHEFYSRLQHHLNGEVGVVISCRDISRGIHLEVQFEKRSLRSEWIHQDRLHIAYESPSIENFPMSRGRVLGCKGRILYYGSGGKNSYEVG